jgi:hypothetical protein
MTATVKLYVRHDTRCGWIGAQAGDGRVRMLGPRGLLRRVEQTTAHGQPMGRRTVAKEMLLGSRE